MPPCLGSRNALSCLSSLVCLLPWLEYKHSEGTSKALTLPTSPRAPTPALNKHASHRRCYESLSLGKTGYHLPPTLLPGHRAEEKVQG